MPSPRKDNPAPDPAPDPVPAPPADGEPDWAVRLRETIEQLPGKLKASITDDDRRGIAESVHGLFEQSGAFKRDGPADPDPTDPEPDNPAPKTDPAPTDRPPEKDSWARRTFGPH